MGRENMTYNTQSGRGRFVISALLIAVSLYYAQTAFAISVNRWLKLNKDGRVAYISGVLDAWDNDVSLCEKSKSENAARCAYVKLAYAPIVLCSEHRPYNEIFAIVEKYVREHSAQGERSMAGQIWVALYESCAKNTGEKTGEDADD